MGEIDTAALKGNFAAAAANGGDDVAMYFYSYLFLKYPETRAMFPPAMTRQRDRLVGALIRIVTDVDNVANLVPYLEDLGRDHRKFGAVAAHYPAVGEALLTTLRHFSGDSWTQKLHDDWAAAYGIVAGAMVDAGYAKRNGDRLVCKILFSRGQLTVNGKPQAIPGLGGPPAESTGEAIRPAE